MNMEKKNFEIKTEDINDKGEFIGIASFYGNVDYGNDIVEKGAFEKTLVENKNEVVMLWQHDHTQPIGKFLLRDTEKGLEALGFINLEVEKGREAHALLKQGAIKGLSIGFITKDWEYEGKVRKIKDVDLKEVSLVTFPMNNLANVELESVKSEEVEDDTEAKEFVENFKSYLKNYILLDKKEEIKKYINKL